MIETSIRGGLGNQMFQYAAARNYQLMHGDKLCFNIVSYQKDRFGRSYALNKLNIDPSIQVYEKRNAMLFVMDVLSRRFPEIVLRWGIKIGYFIWNGKKFFKPPYLIQKRKYLYSYFQSEKYFFENQDIIKKELRIKEAEKAGNGELLNSILKTNSVCVHVRRGDYVTGNLLMCTLDYYRKGIAYVLERVDEAELFVFSDDIEWAKNNIKAPCRVHFIDNVETDYEELQLMYSCRHFVISNSSFSWWAQYLSESVEKIVIAPPKWMPDDKERRAIYMDSWIVME